MKYTIVDTLVRETKTFRKGQKCPYDKFDHDSCVLSDHASLCDIEESKLDPCSDIYDDGLIGIVGIGCKFCKTTKFTYAILKKEKVKMRVIRD